MGGGGGGVVYLTTKRDGGYNGKQPIFLYTVPDLKQTRWCFEQRYVNMLRVIEMKQTLLVTFNF